MKRLILTATPDFLPQPNEDYIYLGPWCRPIKTLAQLKQEDETPFIPMPRSQHEQTYRDCKHIEDLCDSYFPHIAGYLNRYQPSPKSTSFWATHLTSWFSYWAAIAYSRLRALEFAEQYARVNGPLLVYTVPCAWPTGYFNNESEFAEFAGQSHAFNLELFSDILRVVEFEGILASLQTTYRHPEEDRHERSPHSPTSLSQKLRLRLEASSRIHLADTVGLSFKERFTLLNNLDPMRFFRRPARTEFLKDNSGSHLAHLQHADELTLGGPNSSRIEKVINKLTLRYLPNFAFWDIRIRTPKTLWVGVDFYSSAFSSREIAEVCENEGSWYCAQHGGGYGQELALTNTNMEFNRTKGFLTWGWEEYNWYKPETFTILPSIKLSKLKELAKQTPRTNTISYYPNNFPPYRSRLETTNYPHLLPGYYKDQYDFLSNVTPNIRSKLQYLAYSHNYGSHHQQLLEQHFPDITFEKSTGNPTNLVSSSLVIVDYLGTVLLESLATNTPTVFFKRTDNLGLNPVADRLITSLEKAEVVFNTPEAAAHKLNSIWPNISQWWDSDTVQSARTAFCATFARTSPQYLNAWKQFLQQELRQLNNQPLSQKQGQAPLRQY